MRYRKLIYVLSFLMLFPALILYMAGVLLMLVVIGGFIANLLTSEWGSLAHSSEMLIGASIPMVAGYIGLASAWSVMFDVAGSPVSQTNIWRKRLGLIVGLCIALLLAKIFKPSLDIFFGLWMLPITGGFVLLILTFMPSLMLPKNSQPE
jgi:uncharacterized protein YacL